MLASTPRRRSTDARPLRVVLFSGGRGADALTRQLAETSSISFTLVINGYDDGASTGKVRRWLGDSLGPSDFRKTVSRLAAALGTCSPGLLELLDTRFPAGTSATDARSAFLAIREGHTADVHGLRAVADRLHPVERTRVTDALGRFEAHLADAKEAFDFSDCSLGNLIFAGIYLSAERHFNRAVDAYASLAGLPERLIENVTDGTNAWLVGIDSAGRLLATEEELVDVTRPHGVRDIFLLDRPLTDAERAEIDRYPERALALLQAHTVSPPLNPQLPTTIAAADLIIYAPGTQHSSLFPSYLTHGLSAAIAANLSAIKLLITNIQSDAEITGSNAVDIIDRAVFYLKEKGRLSVPTPCLITHYLLNDPERQDAAAPYVPLGPIESIEDPRLVRIGNYEEGITGRHDAARVLAPFIDAIVSRQHRRRVAVLLHDAGSINKNVQTMLEMVRGGISRLSLDVTVFYAGSGLDETFTSGLPFSVVPLPGGDVSFARAARDGGFDFVVLFESSGMYRGEDLVALASHLSAGQLAAVWGSRRLSVRDIQESYRLRYRKNVLLGAISFVGSHILSLAYLVLYGRYISDTLSGVRAVRASDAFDAAIDLTHKRANHMLLSGLLRRKADVLEIPVRFFPISPERVKRTSPLEGLQALATILRRRIVPVRSPIPKDDAVVPVGEPTPSRSQSPR